MRIIFVILICFISNSCYADYEYPQSLNKSSEDFRRCRDIDDPFEKLNRKIFMFNSVLDHFLLRPIAKGYRNALSEETKYHIGSALYNLQVPLTTVNYTLQMDGKNALLSFWQFVINSTLGVAGFEDVAGKQGLHVQSQTLGSTLANYGVAPGPYIVLPFFGSTNSRDMFDLLFANSAMNPINYKIPKTAKHSITGGRLVHERAEILPFTDHITKTSTDPYIAIRSAIHQSREKIINYPIYYRCKTHD